MRQWLALSLALLATGCGGGKEEGAIYLQRFFVEGIASTGLKG